jgi:capsule polysaccharide export protein KpsE/RkpR
MSTDNSGYTGSPAPGSGADDASEHEAKMDALKLKADAAGRQVSAALRGTVVKVQAQLDDVLARVAYATGDERNALLAREAQLRAELDQARMELRALGASAESQVADAVLHPDK